MGFKMKGKAEANRRGGRANIRTSWAERDAGACEEARKGADGEGTAAGDIRCAN